jgi:hypothetical protein
MSTVSPTPPKWIGWCAILVLALGSLQFVGDCLGSSTLRGIGAALGFAPFTKVFSDVDGFETFAADFTLSYQLSDGSETFSPITPEFYQQLEGPYNRRNIYGAALSYAPRLPDELWQSVFCYGFNGTLRDEFGIPADANQITIHIATRTQGRDDTWKFTPACSE